MYDKQKVVNNFNRCCRLMRDFHGEFFVLYNYFLRTYEQRENLDIGQKESVQEFYNEEHLYDEFLSYQEAQEESFREAVKRGDITKSRYDAWVKQVSSGRLILSACKVALIGVDDIEIKPGDEYTTSDVILGGFKFKMKNEDKGYIAFKDRKFANYKDESDSSSEDEDEKE